MSGPAGMTGGEAVVTILVDNRAGEGLLAEHGFSVWLEADGRRILFDTGQGALEFNARLLGIDLGKTDVLVLSHGHYDHTGGIPSVLRNDRRVEVYGHPGIAAARCAIRDGNPRAIGLPREAATALETSPPGRFHPVTAPTMITENVGLSGPIPRATPYEDTGGPFFLDAEGKAPDPIEDDLALWIRTGEGLVVLAGCAHAGIVNTLGHVRRLAGNLPIRAVVGGLHLKEASRDRLDRTVGALRSMGPGLVVPCHCTGDKAVAALKDAFGERVSPGAAGMTFRFGSLR